MSQNQFEICADQENLRVRKHNVGLQVRSTRPVLGEIQNTRRQPLRAAKQVEKGNEGESSKSFVNSLPAQRHSVACISCHLEDKENAVRANSVQIQKDPDGNKLEDLNPTFEYVDSFTSSNISSSLDEESPMVLSTSVQILPVPEYSQDIYCYLREAETKQLPKWNYMSKQTDITHSMRAILVDWLVEVAEEYKLQTETLYLAVAYIDRFLSYMSVQRAKLQLVGAACMFIACKYEEIYPPDVGEFVYITDDTYNKRQVLRMEHLVLKVLEFDLSTPSSHLFVSQLGDMSRSDEKTQHLAMYLNELSLMSGENFLQYSPSLMAAASLALARHTVGLEVWPAQVAETSKITIVEMQECLLALHAVHEKAETCPQQAIREKYKSSKYHSVSDIPPTSFSHQ